MEMKHLKPYHLAWIVCLVAAGLYFMLPKKAPVETSDSSSPVAGSSVGGPFTLTDHDGHLVTDKSWPGEYLLVYFGFTYCPDVCPLGLNRITDAMNKLPQDIQERIRPVFITVDPERDTVEELKKYVALFHPRMVGLTGTPEQIDEVKKTYRVYAEKEGDSEHYMVNHSAYTYLMAPDGTLEAIFSHDTTVDEMAGKLKDRVN